MLRSRLEWWRRLLVQRKVETVLLCLLTPLLCTLTFDLFLISNQLSNQTSRHNIVLVRERVGNLVRLAIDIEDSFRGYLLTRRPQFMATVHGAEAQLATEIDRTSALLEARAIRQYDFAQVEQELREFLSSKQALIRMVDQGRFDDVMDYVRSGEGVQRADGLRTRFRGLEDQLDRDIAQYDEKDTDLSELAFRGLLGAVAGTLLLGWFGALVLARSVTEPLALLKDAMRSAGQAPERQLAAMESAAPVSSGDEIGELARSYVDMARRIRSHLLEIEALQNIGHEINTNTMGPEELAGLLRRITDRAVELMGVDLCLVLLRHEHMGCWIIEAASGSWHDQLRKSVMLWEELPISVRAFETGKPETGERLRDHRNPELSRRNLLGNSMLALPLLNQGISFGVLALLSEQDIRPEQWNQRLALGLAEEVAVAISNARLAEMVQEKHESLRTRVSELEHLAEAIAHDLKGPGQRMAELASLLKREYGTKLDERGSRWLALVERNGNELTDRAEGILTVARVGARHDDVTSVDPGAVIHDVCTSRAIELDAAHARLTVQDKFPPVACHKAYLRQIVDNLISNAMKFARQDVLLEIGITAERHGKMLYVTVADNGIGIPAAFRERVFDAFVRLDSSHGSGSGIGLTIVRRIVELYGGRVWIGDSDGGGAAIVFSLPLLEDWEAPAVPAGEEHTHSRA